MMRKITLRGLRAHPVRFIATMLAVIFGTAFLSGALVLKDSVSATFEANTTAALKNVDVAVVPNEQRALASFESNPTIPTSVLETVRGTPGVRASAGTLQGSLRTLGADGKPIGGRATGYLRISDDALNPFRLQAGAWPAATGEVAVDKETLSELGIAVGGSIDLATAVGRKEARVVGEVSYLTIGRDGTGPNVVVNEVDAFPWFLNDRTGYQSVLVAGTDPNQAPALTQVIRTALSDEPRATVRTGDEQRSLTAGAAAGIANAVGTGLTVFAGVALFICLFIVYNTFTTVVAQRVRELALLRAIGASGRQIRRAVLFESAVVGITASAIGLLLGVLLALALAKAAPGIVSGGNGSQVNLSISAVTVAVVMVIGTIITVLSALIPAFRSSRVKPIQALRTAAVDRSGRNKFRAIIGMVFSGLGIATLILAVSLDNGLLLLPGPGLLFFGLLFAGPNLASLFARAAGAAGMRRRVTSRLATDNLNRNPRRAATTANALVIGVFLVVFVTAAGGALRDFATDTVSRFGGADLNIGSENNVAIPAEIGDRVSAIPGVRDSVAVYGNFGRAALPGATASQGPGGGPQFPPSAVDLAKGESALGLKVKSGKPFAQIASGEAALQDFADFFGGGGGGGGSGGQPNPNAFPGLGDKMEVTFTNGVKRVFTIVTMVDISLSVPPLLISPADALATVPDAPVVQFSLNTEPGQFANVKRELDTIANDYANVIVYEGAFVVQFLKDFFNGLISAVNALLGVAVVVAIFGIVNTLVLAITERTQEIGLLRAVGMTRAQLRSSIRSESILVSLLGTLLGVVSGLFVAYCVATTVIERTGGFAWPIQSLLLITVAGVVVGVLASLIPAARAAKLDILESIKSE